MNKAKARRSGILRWVFAVGLLALLSGAASGQAQDQSAQTPVPEQTQKPDQSQKQAGRSVRPTQDQTTQDQTKQDQAPPDQAKPAPSKEPEEVKITPRQAEDLFHSVDEILEFDSKQSGLPIKREVKRKLTSRDEVVSYLTKHLNEDRKSVV